MHTNRLAQLLYLTVFVLASFALIGCGGSLIARNPKSEIRQGEVFSVELEHHCMCKGEKCVCTRPPWPTGDEDSGEEGLAVALAPIAIDYALRFIAKEAKKEASRYEAVYSGAAADDWFFQDRYAYADTMLSEVVLKRTYYDPRTKCDKIAMLLRLKVVQAADKTHFRFEPTEFQLLDAAAKLRKGDDTVDLKIELAMDYFYLQGDAAEASTIKMPAIVLKNARLNTKWSGDKKQIPRSLKNISSHFFPVPLRTRREINEESFFGLGCYAIRAIITESDEFGEEVHQAAEYLEKDETKQGITEELLKLFTKITGSGALGTGTNGSNNAPGLGSDL